VDVDMDVDVNMDVASGQWMQSSDQRTASSGALGWLQTGGQALGFILRHFNAKATFRGLGLLEVATNKRLFVVKRDGNQKEKSQLPTAGTDFPADWWEVGKFFLI